MSIAMTMPFEVRPAPRWIATTKVQPREAPKASIWPGVAAHASVMTYTKVVLDSLVELGDSSLPNGISVDTARKAYGALGRCLSSESIYPAITPGGAGSVNLYWRAGRRSIEIELESDDSYFFRAIDASGSTIAELEGKGLFPTAPAKHLLFEFSKHVASVNPDWRQLFKY